MTASITVEDAQYALSLVRSICEQVGPGAPGTPQERERAMSIQKELEMYLGAGNVAIEEFTLAPWGFLGSLPLSALLALVAVLANITAGRSAGGMSWILAGSGLVCSGAALAVVIFEYIRYFELVDPLFKKRRSVNVIGRLRRQGSGEARRLLILSGHHDSAWENTWIGLLGYGLYVTVPTILIGYLVLMVLCIIQLVGLAAGNEGIVHFGSLGWGLLVYPVVPAMIFAALFNRGRKSGGTVPGAADNLSACAVSVATCRYLVQHPETIPVGIEIRFISFGSEEAGLRGSRRYVERHLEELKQLDARLLNYETVAYPDITITTTDVDGVKHSPEMVKSVVAAAERAGVPYRVAPSPTGGGGSDAGSFSQAGLKAVNLLPFKVPQQLVAFYHQKKDTPDVLTVEPILNALKLTLEWVRCGGE